MDDMRRREFLAALDESDEVDVENWEAGFIESNLSRKEFTPKQRDTIDEMMAEYGNRVWW
jgi:hypothetical protein